MIGKLVLGTVQFGMPYGINNTKGQPALEEVYSLLHTAYQQGIHCLDTAEAYGNAQELIGNFHRTAGGQTFSVITKYSPKAITTEVAFIEQLMANLETLQVDSLEAYLFHSFDLYQNFPYWNAIERLLAEKRLHKIGVSVYTNEQAAGVAADPRVNVVQLPFNLLDNLSCRGDVLLQLKTQKKEVHVRSAFLQGLFYKNRNKLGSLVPLKDQLLQLDALAKEANVDVATLALTYCLHQPLIDKVLIGVETEVQLLNNIRVAARAAQIDPAVFSAVDNIQVTAPALLNPSNWL